MSTLNILRYTSLGLGLVAGYRYDSRLKKEAKIRAEDKAYQEKLQLVQEAKNAFNEQNKQPKSTTEVSKNEKIDLEDPNLDYGKIILNAVETLKN